MHARRGMTLTELVVVVALVSALFCTGALAAFGLLGPAREKANRAICMGNLGSINKALVIYKASNDDKYPWLGDHFISWETAKVGVNRNKAPAKDNPWKPRERSLTALPFLLVRMGQPAKMFNCPSDPNAAEDTGAKACEDDGDVEEGDYYWDFSKPENVSYSFQSPRYVNANACAQGIEAGQTEMVITADMTPRYGPGEKWTPKAVDEGSSQEDIEKQMSRNHGGKQVNVLKVAGNVKAEKRPDVGVVKDNIYTAYGTDFKNRRTSTSTKLTDHVKSMDTFLIGPVGRREAK